MEILRVKVGRIVRDMSFKILAPYARIPAVQPGVVPGCLYWLSRRSISGANLGAPDILSSISIRSA